MVVIPGLAGDQPFVAAAVHEFGAGIALPGDADATRMRAAALEVLSNPAFREEAKRRSKALADSEGAALAAHAVESLLNKPDCRSEAEE